MSDDRRGIWYTHFQGMLHDCVWKMIFWGKTQAVEDMAWVERWSSSEGLLLGSQRMVERQVWTSTCYLKRDHFKRNNLLPEIVHVDDSRRDGAGFLSAQLAWKTMELPGMLHSQWLFLCVSAQIGFQCFFLFSGVVVSFRVAGRSLDFFFGGMPFMQYPNIGFFCHKKYQQKIRCSCSQLAVGNLELD